MILASATLQDGYDTTVNSSSSVNGASRGMMASV